MKTEADFKDGKVVIFTNKAGTSRRAGTVDYSEGEEEKGFVRVRQIFSESSDIGNIMLIPVERIFTPPRKD